MQQLLKASNHIHTHKHAPLELFKHLVDGAWLVFVLLFGGQLKHRLQGATAAASVPRSMHSTKAGHSTHEQPAQSQHYRPARHQARRATAVQIQLCNTENTFHQQSCSRQHSCRRSLSREITNPHYVASLQHVSCHHSFQRCYKVLLFKSRCLTSSSSSSSAKAPWRACTLPGSGRLGAAATADGM
jgi:hypothetical protein